MPSIVQMEAEVLRQLVTEVKETVALNLDLEEGVQQSSFGTVDMWNIRRTMKTANRIYGRNI